MTQTRTLLAATDFSDPARHALERAAQLAATHIDARLTLTHAISSSMLERLLGLMQGDTLTVKDRLLHETQAALGAGGPPQQKICVPSGDAVTPGIGLECHSRSGR